MCQLCNRLNQARKELFSCTLQILLQSFLSLLYPITLFELLVMYQLSGLSPKQSMNIDISIKHTKQQKMAWSYVLCCFSFSLPIVYQHHIYTWKFLKLFFSICTIYNTWPDMHATAIVIWLNSTTNSTVTPCIVKH